MDNHKKTWAEMKVGDIVYVCNERRNALFETSPVLKLPIIEISVFEERECFEPISNTNGLIEYGKVKHEIYRVVLDGYQFIATDNSTDHYSCTDEYFCTNPADCKQYIVDTVEELKSQIAILWNELKTL